MSSLFILDTGPGESPADDSVLTALRHKLGLCRLRAGRPTYRVIGKETGLSASTICRIFTAKSVPTWDNLKRVLIALKAAPSEIETEWLSLWEMALIEKEPIAVGLEEGLAAPGREHCAACGVWIAKPDTHAEMHRKLEELQHKIDQLLNRPSIALTPLDHGTLANR